MQTAPAHTSDRQNLLEVTGLFFKLGLTAFGGPAAHIAIMHNEVVKRRRWLSDQEFLDLLGATNLIPGPNSTEMAIHLGLRRAGWAGFFIGGLGFTLPAVLMVLGLAWLYVNFGNLPQISGVLYGIKPVIVVIILQALWDLGHKVLNRPLPILVAGLVLGSYFLGINEVALLLGGGVIFALVTNLRELSLRKQGFALLPLGGLNLLSTTSSLPFSLTSLFLIFLKVGAILYGSGYVLLAFLRADLVVRYGWLSDQQLLDAIAVGQMTPGPLFTSATFIGYLLGGLPGALLATLGIFLPSFFFVALSSPLIPRLRGSKWAAAFLDGVNATSLGLMAAVTWHLARTSLVDLPSLLIAGATFGLLAKYKINTTWLILGGALLGGVITLLRSSGIL